MIRILTIPTGFLSANCYIVIDREKGVLIDPGAQPEQIIEIVRRESVTIAAVLITHGHFDHVGAVAAVVRECKCPVYMSKEDRELYSGQSDFFSTLGGDVHDSFEFYEDRESFSFSPNLEFRVIPSPGHSSGGVCLALASAKILFTGDTLFEGTIGRTDLPGSDPNAMRGSLRRIMKEFPDYAVYPGHGEATTMRQEIDSNPFLRRLNKE